MVPCGSNSTVRVPSGEVRVAAGAQRLAYELRLSQGAGLVLPGGAGLVIRSSSVAAGPGDVCRLSATDEGCSGAGSDVAAGLAVGAAAGDYYYYYYCSRQRGSTLPSFKTARIFPLIFCIEIPASMKAPTTSSRKT